MLNPIQIIALNVLVTAGLFAVLMVAGMGWLPAMLWAWIGGGVVTLYCAVTLVVVFERRDSTVVDMQRNRHRMHVEEIIKWEEDALDDLWETSRQETGGRHAAQIDKHVRNKTGTDRA